MSLISVAYAADGAAPQGGMGSMLLMLGMLFLFMYFMVIRPQAKKAKEHRKLMDSLQVGNEIVTIGGLYGTIAQIAADTVVLQVSDNAKIIIQKGAIATVLPQGSLNSLKK